MTSCGASYHANQTEKSFKGSWVLESVTYPDASGFFDVELLGLADVSCFENSVWKFIPNNSSGNLTLDGGNCAKSSKDFIWYIDAATLENAHLELLLKMTNGKNAKEVTKGSRIIVKSLSDNRMTWEQDVMFDGKSIKLEFTFLKL